MGRFEAFFYISTSGRSLKAIAIVVLLVLLVLQVLQGNDVPEWLLAIFTLVFGSLFDNGDKPAMDDVPAHS